jgi:hypothetical protein
VAFGELIRGLSPREVLRLEAERSSAEVFAAQDALVSRLVLRSLAGERLARIEGDRPFDRLEFLGLANGDLELLCDAFSLSDQQAHGAWFLPEQASIHVGEANLPYHFQHYERFAGGVAHDEGGKLNLALHPEALFFWAVLDPLFACLYRPMALRGPSPSAEPTEQQAAWAEVDAAYALLGIDVGDALEVMKYGGGWSKLRASERLDAKKRLIGALRGAMPSDIGSRFRVFSTQTLVERYYVKARQRVPAMRSVLTKPLQKTLAGFFRGDWLGFLRYVEERPSPDEQISVALPEPKLYVDAARKVAAAATKHAVPPEEIDRILASFWSGETAESPVHQRIAVLRDFWGFFETIHACQAPGMRPLWGLIEGSDTTKLVGVDSVRYGPPWYHPGQEAELLPGDLQRRISQLWEGLFLSASPGRIVTALSPCFQMVQAFGPALQFWHGAALTAWFVSEGPYSRTDMAGLAKYHERDLAELAELGCPVEAGLFEDLIAAERQLGEPQPVADPEHGGEFSAGPVKVTLTVTVGSRRAGFERLRDVLTAHRQVWAARFLEEYFRARWETEIRGAAREYSRLYEVKRKAPTPKQFARYAEAATNHWFGGDVSLLYTALGESSPMTPIRARLLPSDLQEFLLRVFEKLGGAPTSGNIPDGLDAAERAVHKASWENHCKRKDLAERSVQYVRLLEAFGRRPTIKEFGTWALEYLLMPLQLSWDDYADAVDACIGTRAG